MDPALLYRPRGGWMFWIALGCAAAIHVGAVVAAKGKYDRTGVEALSPPAVDVEVIQPEPEQIQPRESFAPAAPQVAPDENTFAEKDRPPHSIGPHKKIRVTTFTKGTAAPFDSLKASVIYAPRAIYPYEARRQRATGSGIALLTIDPATGSVTSVRMWQSCGMLDKCNGRGISKVALEARHCA